MVMRRRFFKKKEDVLKGTGYDSMLEKNMHETVLKDTIFHSKDHSVSYSIPHKYEPDFIFETNDTVFYIETKGRFRDSTEAAKYQYIREYLPPNSELVFIWDKVGTRFPFAKRRKDGSYLTHEEWATKGGFRHWNQSEFTLDLLCVK